MYRFSRYGIILKSSYWLLFDLSFDKTFMGKNPRILDLDIPVRGLSQLTDFVC